MEKAKEFLKKHKMKILIVSGLILSYRLGFKNGCKATNDAVDHLINETTKAFNIIHNF